MTECRHTRVSRDTYEYCEDCGAVRLRDIPGKPSGEWHSCALCRLPVSLLQEVLDFAGEPSPSVEADYHAAATRARSFLETK